MAIQHVLALNRILAAPNGYPSFVQAGTILHAFAALNEDLQSSVLGSILDRELLREVRGLQG